MKWSSGSGTVDCHAKYSVVQKSCAITVNNAINMYLNSLLWYGAWGWFVGNGFLQEPDGKTVPHPLAFWPWGFRTVSLTAAAPTVCGRVAGVRHDPEGLSWHTGPCACPGCREALRALILSAVHTAHYSSLRHWAVQSPYQAAMHPVKMLSVVPLKKAPRGPILTALFERSETQVWNAKRK